MPKIKVRPKKTATQKGPEKPSPSSLAQRVLAHQKKRFRLPDLTRPLDANGEEYIPTLPPDITLLNDEDLGRLHGEFVSFANYVESCFAHAEVDELEAVEEEKITNAAEVISQHGEGPNQEWRRASVLLEPRAIETRKRRREAKAMTALLGARLNGCERAIKVLSREQTRREKKREWKDAE